MNNTNGPRAAVDLIPLAAIFLIVFSVTWRAIGQLDLCPRRLRPILALCVSTLAVFGMDRSVIPLLLIPYHALGLVLLALFLLVLSLRLIPPCREGRPRADTAPGRDLRRPTGSDNPPHDHD